MAIVLLNVRIEGTPLVFGLPLAVLGGLLSFVSPWCAAGARLFWLPRRYSCRGAGAAARRPLTLNGLAFVLGFSAVFTIAGVAVGQLLTNVQAAQGYVRWVGGIVVILLGFHTLGVIRIPILMRSLKVQPLWVVGRQRAATSSASSRIRR